MTYPGAGLTISSGSGWSPSLSPTGNAGKIVAVNPSGTGFEFGLAGTLSDDAYDATAWDGVTSAAPTKNAVRDKFETLGTASTKNVGTLTDTKYCIWTTGVGFVCNSNGGSVDLTAPGPIGGTTPATGTFTTLKATVSISAPVIADTTLSGTPVVITIYDQATNTPYYFKAYPTKP